MCAQGAFVGEGCAAEAVETREAREMLTFPGGVHVAGDGICFEAQRTCYLGNTFRLAPFLVVLSVFFLTLPVAVEHRLATTTTEPRVLGVAVCTTLRVAKKKCAGVREASASSDILGFQNVAAELVEFPCRLFVTELEMRARHDHGEEWVGDGVVVPVHVRLANLYRLFVVESAAVRIRESGVDVWVVRIF